MTAVWALDLASTDKLVLLALADNANDDGACWPSIHTIGTKASLSNRAVQMSIARLKTSGHLRISERYGRSNVFTITPALGAPPHQMHPAPDAPSPPHDVHPTPARRAPTPARRAPRICQEPPIEPPIESYATRALDPEARDVPRGTETETHERVMLIKAKWPLGASYEDWITAEKLIRNLVSGGTSWDLIESGVERYAKCCRATHRMVANPGKWFAEVGRPWLAQWAIPPNKAEVARDSNIENSQEWLHAS